MISWIQKYFQHHFRVIFAVLLGVVIIAFVFTIGAARKLNVDLFDGPMTALSVQIFGNAQTPYAAAQDRAWGAALTLVAIVFLFTILARLVSARIARRHNA